MKPADFGVVPVLPELAEEEEEGIELVESEEEFEETVNFNTKELETGNSFVDRQRGFAKVIYDDGDGEKEAGEIVGRLAIGEEVVIETISGTIKGTVVLEPETLVRNNSQTMH